MSETQHTDLLVDEPEQITISQAEEYLRKPYPVWLLTPQGVVITANLLVSWLWEVPQLKDLFGINVFEVFYNNRRRIQVYQNEEFFRKKMPVLKRLIGGFGEEPYTSFLDYVKHDPYLKQIYDQVKYIPDKKWTSRRVWEYSLKILPPIGTGISEFLKFHVTVYRLIPNNDFLAIYEPHLKSKITHSLLEQEYSKVMAISDMIAYVQYEKDIDRYKVSEQKGGEVRIKQEHTSEKKQEFKEEVGRSNLDQAMLEKAVKVLGDAREQQLEALAQRKDFPPFIIKELQEKLAALKEERTDWEKVDG